MDKQLENKPTAYLIGQIEGLTQLIREKAKIHGLKDIESITSNIDKTLQIIFERHLNQIS